MKPIYNLLTIYFLGSCSIQESDFHNEPDVNDLFASIEQVIDKETFQSKPFFILIQDDVADLNNFFTTFSKPSVFLGNKLQKLTIEQAFMMHETPLNYIIFSDFLKNNETASVTISIHVNCQETTLFFGIYEQSTWKIIGPNLVLASR